MLKGFNQTLSIQETVIKNADSSQGISGRKWILAARSTCNTLVSSFSGCVFAVFYSLYMTNGKADILMVINGILGALVGVTGKHYTKFISFNNKTGSQLVSRR